MTQATREIHERELYALVVRTIGVVVTIVVIVCAVYQLARDIRIADALKAGADPLGVACVYGSSTSQDACALATASTNMKRVNR